jgi:hypothetical protein
VLALDVRAAVERVGEALGAAGVLDSRLLGALLAASSG